MKTVECCVYEMQVKLLIAHHEPIDIISFASQKHHVHATYVDDLCIGFVRPLLTFVRNFRLLFRYLFNFSFVSLSSSFCGISIVYRHNFIYFSSSIIITILLAMRKAIMCRYVCDMDSNVRIFLANQN